LAGRYSVRVGMNRMVLWGCIATTSGMLALLALSFSGMMTAAGFFGLTLIMGLGNGITLPNANAGILSVRPELAGSAAGLGGAIMIGGGAALAALATAILPEGATERPLVWLMLASSVASVVAILWVIRRAKVLGLPG